MPIKPQVNENMAKLLGGGLGANKSKSMINYASTSYLDPTELCTHFADAVRDAENKGQKDGLPRPG